MKIISAGNLTIVVKQIRYRADTVDVMPSAVSLVRRRSQQFVFLCSFSVLLFQLPVIASQSIVLAWMPSTDPEVDRYRIYSGTASHNYVNQVTVNNTNVATLSGLADAVTYYFAAVSVDSAGNESSLSDELAYTTPSAAGLLTILPAATGWFSFSVGGVDGYQYIVESSPNLKDWTVVQTNTSPFTVTVPAAPGAPKCFYRTFHPPQ